MAHREREMIQRDGSRQLSRLIVDRDLRGRRREPF